MNSWRRPLGRTGLEVTPLGLGLAALGRPGYINLGRPADLGVQRSVAAMRTRAHEVLDAASELEIGYIDVARSYGRAEEFLAGWLTAHAVAPGAITVGSKWGYTYTAGWQVHADRHEVKDHSSSTLARQLPESQALLAPWLGLYQIHSATLETGVLDDPAVLDALVELSNQGLVVGLSTSGPHQADTIRRAVATERHGRRVFSTVQSTWNLLERSAGAALADAHDAGLGVIVKEALANGRLTEHGDLPGSQHAALLAAGQAAGKGGSSTEQTGVTLDQVALAGAMAQPWADVVLSGAATVGQLRSNAEAVALSTTMDLDPLDDLVVPAERYWAQRSAMDWA